MYFNKVLLNPYNIFVNIMNIHRIELLGKANKNMDSIRCIIQ